MNKNTNHVTSLYFQMAGLIHSWKWYVSDDSKSLYSQRLFLNTVWPFITLCWPEWWDFFFFALPMHPWSALRSVIKPRGTNFKGHPRSPMHTFQFQFQNSSSSDLFGLIHLAHPNIDEFNQAENLRLIMKRSQWSCRVLGFA